MFRTAPSRTPADRLSTFFGASQPRTSFEDVDIEEIGRLLLRCGHFAYKSPRTYIVLRTIGRLDLLQQLLSDGFDDGMFPVEKRGLPAFLDPRVRTSIFEAQDMILTKSLDLESGRHCHFHARGDLPFEILSYIGSGSFGQVRRIESKITFKQYALKTIRRQAAFKQSKQAVQEFLREMRIIKSLDHRHIIQYIGSYTDKRDLGLVLNPIAECDLATYLLMACTRPEWHATLRTFFGCLATALCYLHDEDIRHRDIKPQNILVYKASVLLTDFGLSREALDTTYGPTAATSRYQAPEVAALERRNETADIWSLGCVFLEMLTALQGYDVEWLKSYYEDQGTHSSHPHANPEATRNLLREWKATLAFDQAKPITWIERMLVIRRDNRPTAADIMSDITAPEDGTGFMYSCDMCYGDWSDSNSYSSSIEDDSSTSSRSAIFQKQRPTGVPRRISIFNQPLHNSIQYAAYDIAHIPFFCGGKTFSCSSPVPIVFGKCIEHILYIEGGRFQGCLMSQPEGHDYAKRCARLKDEFETRTQRGLTYTIYDCVHVLFDYIATIPRLLCPEHADYNTYVPRLDCREHFAEDLSTLDKSNFDLILSLLAFFAAYAELGRAHYLGYWGWISRLAQLFDSIVIRPCELSLTEPSQTLCLILENPSDFISMADEERRKRAGGFNFDTRIQARSPSRTGALQEQPRIRSSRRYAIKSGHTNYDEHAQGMRSRIAIEGKERYRRPSFGDAIHRDTGRKESELSTACTSQRHRRDESKCRVARVNDSDDESETVIRQILGSEVSEREENGEGIAEELAYQPVSGLQEHMPTIRATAEQDHTKTQMLLVDPDSTTELGIMAEQNITKGKCKAVGEGVTTEAAATSPEKTSLPGLWSLPIENAIELAGSELTHLRFVIDNREVTISGRFPVVLTKCIEYTLSVESQQNKTAPYCLRADEWKHPERHEKLKETFNTPPTYGREIDWTEYKPSDASLVMYEYLRSLPEPLLPSQLTSELPPLTNYIKRNYMPTGFSLLESYAKCITKLQGSNRQLLLLVIAWFAAQVSSAQNAYMSDRGGWYNEAAEQLSSVLCEPNKDRRAIITLLIVNAGCLISIENGQAYNDGDWARVAEDKALYIKKDEEEVVLMKDAEQHANEKREDDEAAKQDDTNLTAEERIRDSVQEGAHAVTLEQIRGDDHEGASSSVEHQQAHPILQSGAAMSYESNNTDESRLKDPTEEVADNRQNDSQRVEQTSLKEGVEQYRVFDEETKRQEWEEVLSEEQQTPEEDLVGDGIDKTAITKTVPHVEDNDAVECKGHTSPSSIGRSSPSIGSHINEEGTTRNEASEAEVFGIAFRKSTRYASADLRQLTFDLYGNKQSVAGRVPIVVIKCIMAILEAQRRSFVPCLKTKRRRDTMSRGRYEALKDVFNSPSYGADFADRMFSREEALVMLYKYLDSLPWPIVSTRLSKSWPRIRWSWEDCYADTSRHPIDKHCLIIADMQDPNRHLLLCLLGYFAEYVTIASPTIKKHVIFRVISSTYGPLVFHDEGWGNAIEDILWLLIANAKEILHYFRRGQLSKAKRTQLEDQIRKREEQEAEEKLQEEEKRKKSAEQEEKKKKPAEQEERKDKRRKRKSGSSISKAFKFFGGSTQSLN